MTISIKKWGNSLGVILPAVFLKQAGMKEGTALNIVVTEDGVLLTPERKRNKFTLEERLAMCDLSAPKVSDVWAGDEPVGREVW